MGTTSNRSYPYPAGSDAVDVPGDLQSLADAVDTDVAAVIAGTGLADGSVTDAKLAVPKVDQSVVGNLLTANVATGTDTLGTTAGVEAGGATVASSTAEAYSGSRSIEMTATGSGFGLRIVPSAARVGCVAGLPYTASLWAKSPDTTVNMRLGLSFYDAAGSLVSVLYGPSAALSSSWQNWSATVVAPAGAATFFVNWLRVSTEPTVADVVYVDQATVHQGAGGLWAPPGTPIANLGTYTDESVGRRIFTWDAVNARWQMTYGDTGWRNVVGDLDTGAGWSANSVLLRRMNDTVELAFANLTGPGSADQTPLTVPSGFTPKNQQDFIYNAGTIGGPSGQAFRVQDNGATYVHWTASGDYPSATYLTGDTWPASLPGTASGSIPS